MKSIFKRRIIFSVMLVLLTTVGCKDILDEHPRSVLTPEFFATGQGLTAGITSAYASFRYYYATQGGMNLSVYGTDEFTHGEQVVNPPFSVYNGSLNSAQGDLQTPWNRAYPAINTCNGVIERGPAAADLSEAQRNALIAEAKFIRANWYFILVQTFGGVSLDLGSGPLKFNTSSANLASRATVAEVYDAIINDLEGITDGLDNNDLPSTKPTQPGRAWRASALHLLAKVYLTRGWITNSSADFQKSLDAANDLITNAAMYGVSLLPNYSSVHQQGNENNGETLFQVNWIDNTTYNNNTAFGGPLYQNVSLFLFRCFYSQNIPGMVRDISNGRSFVRYKPTAWLLDGAFADKVNDSRYDKSFQTVWYCNANSTDAVTGNSTIFIPKWSNEDLANGIIPPGRTVGQFKLSIGDTAMFMVPAHLAAKFAPLKNKKPYIMFLPNESTIAFDYFKYLNFKSKAPFFTGDPRPVDEISETPLFVASGVSGGPYPESTLLPAQLTGLVNFAGVNIQNKYYPTLRKFDSTQPRSNNDVNITSVRPFIVYRFAETYLIAAEAALKLGNSSGAAGFIDVVRSRAAVNAGAIPAMKANTLADINARGIDYILDERARELCGEQMRWFDLVRTGKLIERVNLYNGITARPGTINILGAASGTPQEIPNPQPYHVLRPIPQGQIDGSVDPSQDNGKYPQNPGYN